MKGWSWSLQMLYSSSFSIVCYSCVVHYRLMCPKRDTVKFYIEKFNEIIRPSNRNWVTLLQCGKNPDCAIMCSDQCCRLELHPRGAPLPAHIELIWALALARQRSGLNTKALETMALCVHPVSGLCISKCQGPSFISSASSLHSQRGSPWDPFPHTSKELMKWSETQFDHVSVGCFLQTQLEFGENSVIFHCFKESKWCHDFINGRGIDWMKVDRLKPQSGEVTNYPFLKACSSEFRKMSSHNYKNEYIEILG